MTEDARSAADPPGDQAAETEEKGSTRAGSEGTGSSLLDEAMAALEAPAGSEEAGIPEDAIFSPDDPIVREGEERGVVTGMGGEDTTGGEGSGQAGDLAWEIRHAANIMTGLARALQEQGMDALKVHKETDPIDAVLRSFIAGYLVGRTESEL